jgi:hypothetical protein
MRVDHDVSMIIPTGTFLKSLNLFVINSCCICCMLYDKSNISFLLVSSMMSALRIVIRLLRGEGNYKLISRWLQGR